MRNASTIFSNGVRGKYASKHRQGNNVILLDPEVAEAFQIQVPLMKLFEPFSLLRNERESASGHN